ncbi:MAG: hypothetical protein HY544_03920 [Candidatus Diapherotrites archaeon]|uniref:Uncharacterized protein n=1 Tax=Candidatus Iainarchaeum sp. TaxID=3101447 RepID=A0A8T3YKQ3_9ARCH|nr:hypothetical protein [Candidatus Diapherotrites archaeon]
MKLQKHISRRTKDKEYVKWSIIIPEENIKELKWAQGISLKTELKGDSLVLSPEDSKEKSSITGPKKLSYYERFVLVYANLPLEERKLPVIVIEGETFTWARSYLEIKSKTQLGKIIGERLLKLRII